MKIRIKKYAEYALPYIGLVMVLLIFAVLTGGKSLSYGNLSLLAGQVFSTMICSAGVLFVMSMGSLDFSQGSVLGMCGYVATLLSKISIPLAFAAAIICGAAFGLLNGFLVAKLKVKSFVATICIMFMFRGMLQFLCQNYKPSVAPAILKMDNFAVKMIIMVIILVLVFILFNNTKFGRYVRMVGAGETALEYSGVSIGEIKILVFVIAGVLAGISGIFLMLRTGGVIATSGNLVETDVMIGLVLGGLPVTGGMKSRFSAVIIGPLLLMVLGNGLVLIGASVIIQQLFKGIMFLIVIIATSDRSIDVIK